MRHGRRPDCAPASARRAGRAGRVRCRWSPPPQPALAERPAGPPVRLAAGASAFPPGSCARLPRATGCRVRVVPPLPSGALPRAGVDLIEMRGDDAGGLIAAGSPRGDQRAQRDRARRRPGELARRRSRPGRVAPRDPVPVEPAAAARPYQGLRHPAADEPARALLASAGVAHRAAGLAARARAGGALPRHRRPVRPRARRAHVGPRGRRPGAAACFTSTRMRPQLRALFRRGEIDLAVGNPATLGISERGVVAVLPSEGTIATERVLGIVSGSPRGACARAHRRRAARAACPGRALARARVDAGAQRNVRHARGGGLQERGARPVAHAREQRRGRPPRRCGRRHGVARMGRGVGSAAFVTAAGAGRTVVRPGRTCRCRPAVELLGSV